MDERLRFVAQLLDGEAMSEVCRAFGISRKTGYKIFERYKEHGCVASGWLGRLGADIRTGLLLILTAKRHALAIRYLAKIASIRFERLVDCLIGFGSAGDDFREGLLIHVLGLTWAMAGLYASYQAMVGQRPARPRSRIAQRRFDLCYVIQQ